MEFEINHGSVSLSATSRTLILAADSHRTYIQVRNSDTLNAARIGGPGVSATSGYRLAPGESVFAPGLRGAIYGFAEAGTPAITWIYERQRDV